MKNASLGVLLTVWLSLVDVSMHQGLVEGMLSFFFEAEEQYSQGSPNFDALLSTYDFIVVGAGTSGCVVANRLSENPQWKVLLLEAGDHENIVLDIPALVHYMQFSAANWKYKTIPSSKYCQAMDNNQCNWPRGKVMGGSSSINYMIYTRGNRRDYDHWASLGNTGWSYDDVLPYFIKVENFTITEMDDPKYHGRDGHVSVMYPPYRTKLAEAIVEANRQMGIPIVDYNGPTQIGFSYLQSTLKDGLRHSSNKAYILPIRDRKNLHVLKLAMVTRVLIDPATKQAQGVEFVYDGRHFTVNASKEVIVSGGAINSPQLLMLSGIGPRKHLQALNINVVQNLMVGYNLMDHVSLGGFTFLMDYPYTINLNAVLEAQNLNNFLNHHKGPITVPGGPEVIAFHDTCDPNHADGYPDIELLYAGGSIATDEVISKGYGIRDDIYNNFYRSIENKNSFMIFPILLRPKSKGRLMLSSNNYKSKPLLHANYFAVEDDMHTLLAGIRLALNITRQRALADLGVKVYEVPLEGCKQFTMASDEYYACMARHFSFTFYHLSGTCKMGPRNDSRAVVDPRLRVHGIKGLRVIDVSIMPELIAGHTNAAVYMIGEKGADMIKDDWGYIH